MAIEVLKEQAHKPEHDLESLFYVLVWICSLWSSPGVPKQLNLLQDQLPILNWADTMRSFSNIVDFKHGHVSLASLFKERILDKFSQYFEPLKNCAEELRKLFFPPDYGPNRDNRVTHSQFIAILKGTLTQLPLEPKRLRTNPSAFYVLPVPDFEKYLPEDEDEDGDLDGNSID
jgi:Fungal protein kinase